MNKKEIKTQLLELIMGLSCVPDREYINFTHSYFNVLKEHYFIFYFKARYTTMNTKEIQIIIWDYIEALDKQIVRENVVNINYFPFNWN